MSYGLITPKRRFGLGRPWPAPGALPADHRAFQLADTGYEVPLRDLNVAMQAPVVPEGRIRPLAAGEHWWVE